MAKKANKQIIVVLTAAGFLLTTVAGVILARNMRQMDPEYYATKARQFMEEDDYLRAGQYFVRAFNVSEQAKYLIGAGDAFYDMAEEGKALGVWQKAVTIDPSLEAAHEKIVDLRIEIARGGGARSSVSWNRVIEGADRLADANPQNPLVFYGRGLGLIQTAEQKEGNREEGLAQLQRALEVSPENTDFALSLAEFYARNEQVEDAEKTYNDSIALKTEPGPDASDIRRRYALFLAQQGELDKAQEMVAEALAMAGDDADALADAHVARGRLYHTRRALDDIEKERVKRGSKDTAQMEELNKRMDENWENAKLEYEKAIEIAPDLFTSYRALGELYSQKKMFKEGLAVFDARLDRPILRRGLKTMTQRRQRFSMLLAALDYTLAQMSESQDDESAVKEIVTLSQKYIELAEAEFKTSPMIPHYWGKIAMAQDNLLEAISHFEKCNELLAPGIYGPNKRLLAVLLNRTDQPGAARREIEDALRVLKDSTNWSIYAETLLKLKLYKEAVLAASEALRREPDFRQMYVVQLEAYRQLGAYDRMKDVEKRLNAETEAGEDLFLKFRVEAGSERFEEAEKTFQELIEADPTHVQAIRLMVGLLISKDRRDDAVAILDRALAVSPDGIALRSIRARLDTSLSDEERQAEMLEIVKSVENQLDREMELYNYYVSLGEFDSALTHLDKAAELLDTQPDLAGGERDAASRRRSVVDRQFRICCDQKKWSDAEKYVTRARGINADGAGGFFYEGRLFLRKGEDFGLAVAAFRQGLEKLPNHSQGLAWLGEALYRARLVDDAYAAFEAAAEANPGNGSAFKGMAIIADERSEVRDLKKRLKECQRLLPEDEWVAEKSGEFEEEADPTKGIVRREQLLEKSPDNLSNLVRLAQLYGKVGRNADAESTFQKALDLSNGSIEVAWQFSKYYRAINQPEKSLELLQEMSDSSDDPEQQAHIILLIGGHYEDLKQLAKANEAYRKAAVTKPTIGVCITLGKFLQKYRPAESIDWYRKAAEQAGATNSPREGQIRRTLMSVLATNKELELLGQEVKAYQEKFPNDTALLLFKASYERSMGLIDEAIKTLNLYIEKEPKKPQGYFHRGQLYMIRKNWEGAVSDLENVKTIAPKALGYAPRLALANAYDRTGRKEVAIHELESIWKEDPDATNVAEALVALFVKHHQYRDAERVARSLHSRFPDNIDYLATLGEMGRQLKDKEKAYINYQKAAELSDYDPARVGSVMSTYGYFQDFNEALKYATQVVPKDKRSPELAFHMASCYGRLGDKANAVKYYRTALAGGEQGLGFVNYIIMDMFRVLGAGDTIDYFRQEVEKNPNDVIARFNLAYLSNFRQQHHEALKHYAQILKADISDPERAIVMGRMAEAYYALQDFPKAKETYEKILQLKPDSLHALNNLAYLLSEDMRLPEEALPYAEKASELLPDDPNIQDTLGWIYVLLDQYEKGIEALNRTIEKDPDSIPGHIHLAEAYLRKGSFGEARRYYEEARRLLKFTDPQTRNVYEPMADDLGERIAQAE